MWALPGMRIKRWLFLAAVGILLTNLAVGLAVASVYGALAGHGGWAFPVMVLGLVAIAVGTLRMVGVVVEVLQPTTHLVDAIYQHRTRRRGPKLVAIGGGTGLATLLRGLKGYSDNITAIVTVADDGGSSGRLRAELGVQPPGDIRACLIALAAEERLLTDLFRFRFRDTRIGALAAADSTGELTDRGLGGHSFGNLFLAAMIEVSGDLMTAIRYSSRVLAVRGQVLPATTTQMTLHARFADGSEVTGESQITARRAAIQALWCDPASPVALPEALAAIEDADAIILGPGSLYTSIIPHMLIPELREALLRSPAPRLYVCNVMTQPGETDGFTASEHVAVLHEFAGRALCDHILVNNDDALTPLQRERYAAGGQFPVVTDEAKLAAMGVSPVSGSFLLHPSEDEPEAWREVVRHDPARLAASIMRWLDTVPARPRVPTRRVTAPLEEGP